MNTFEKVSLGLYPTPLHRLPNISRELGTNIWIKRDDLCGVALGGNKVRKLEYLLADAKKPNCEIISNLKVLMMSSRNRDNSDLLEQQYSRWGTFFDIMKNYAIISA